MDPCSFVRILVGNLSVKLSPTHKSLSYLCRIKLKNFPTQQVTVTPTSDANQNAAVSSSLSACFTLDKAGINSVLNSKKELSLSIEVYQSGGDGVTCGWRNGRFVGKTKVLLDLRKAETRACVMQNGWVTIGGNNKNKKLELYCSVRAEPDPRYVFQFGGDPECSPQVFQLQGTAKQAVFTCKFSLRNSCDRTLASRTSMSETSTSRNCLLSLGSEKEQNGKERKGWSITIHDLSGSPVAMASMVTPFVPSPGSDHVSRSNPGAWLILRPSQGTWKPWGRLEAWRESRRSAMGYKFELLHDTVTASPTVTTLVSSQVSTKNGGKFVIDMTNSVNTPVCSPHSSCDFGSGSGSGSGSWSGSESGLGWMSQFMYKGFVMSSMVEGDKGSGRAEVEIGVQHVNCTEDAAAYVALAGAVDLSMDACRLFSEKLRKELRQSFVV